MTIEQSIKEIEQSNTTADAYRLRDQYQKITEEAIQHEKYYITLNTLIDKLRDPEELKKLFFEHLPEAEIKRKEFRDKQDIIRARLEEMGYKINWDYSLDTASVEKVE